jgi:4-hydroxy-tetrahydrodipicolinate synthase
MTKDFTFDEAGIRENIDAYVEMGINGLVVGGFIAECWNVKLSDWFHYHEIVADANKGRLDLWTIVLDPSVHQALEKLHFVEKLGFSGAEVINPVVQLRTDDEVYDFFKYLTDASDLAICLYRTAVSGKVLSPDLISRLADLETVVAVKQGTLNHGETLKLRRSLREDFIICDPWEQFFLSDLRHGGQVIWGELSYIVYGKKRTLMKEYVELANAGKWEAAYEKWQVLRPVANFYDDGFIWEIAKTATYASALSLMKAWYEALGLKAGPTLPPVRSISGERKEWLVGELKALGVV